MLCKHCPRCLRALTVCVCLLGGAAPGDHPHAEENQAPSPQMARVTAPSTVTSRNSVLWALSDGSFVQLPDTPFAGE
jgi:hypothetical protein